MARLQRTAGVACVVGAGDDVAVVVVAVLGASHPRQICLSIQATSGGTPERI